LQVVVVPSGQRVALPAAQDVNLQPCSPALPLGQRRVQCAPDAQVAEQL
jgi:hypothetical protein